MPACAASGVTKEPRCGIRKFQTLPGAPNVLRGAQPKDGAAWNFLRSQNIRHVVKLNERRKEKGQPPDETDEGATAAGMSVTRVTFNFGDRWIWTQPEKLDAAVAAIKPGTFVHCQRGMDRTGLVVAAYRVRVLGESKRTVEREMVASGFRPMPGLLWAWLFQVREQPVRNETSRGQPGFPGQ